MSYQVGDKVQVVDASAFDELHPFDLMMFGAPEQGAVGTVVKTDFTDFENDIPEGGQPLFVEFEGGKKYGLLSTEVEKVAA